MSGFMWEADKQPNICEAASSFTFSSINLLIAIPMFTVDLVVQTVLALCSLLWLVVGPIVDYAKIGLALLAEAVGIEEQPSNLSMVLTALLALHVFGQFKENQRLAHGDVYSLVSRYLHFALSLTGLVTVLGLPDYEEVAAFPRLVWLAMLCLTGAGIVRFFMREYGSFVRQDKSELGNFAADISSVLLHEYTAVMLIAAFGYPSFTEADDVTKYYCVVSIAAMMLIFNRLERPEVPAPVPALANGSAVAVKEVAEAETIAAPAIEQEEKKVEEPAEEQEVAVASDDAADEAPGEAAEAPADAADGGEVVKAEAKVEEVPAEPCKYLSSLSGVCANIQGKLCSVVSPVLSCVSCPVSYLCSLPWAIISFFLVTNISRILEAVAWFHLTQNNLAVMLPVFSCLAPPLINKYGDCVMSACAYTAALVEWLPEAGRAVTLYCLVTGAVEM